MANTYKIYRDGNLIASPPASPYLNTGLTNGQQYSYQVSAVNAVGEGPKSNIVLVTPSSSLAGPRPAPTSLAAYAYSSSVTTYSEWKPNLSLGTLYTPGAGLSQAQQDTFIASVPAGTINAPSIIDLRGVHWQRNRSILFDSAAHNYTVIYGYGGSIEQTLLADPLININAVAVIWLSAVHHVKILGLEMKGGHTAAGTYAAYGWDAGRGIGIGGITEDIEIADCRVHNTFSDSLSIYGGDTASEQLQRLNAHNNLFELDGRQSFVLGQGRNVYFERNIVRDSAGGIMDAEDARTTSEFITGLYIRDNLLDGWAWAYTAFSSATTLAANSSAGATNIKVNSVAGLVAGNALQLGTPGTGEATVESRIIANVGTAGSGGTGITVTSAYTYSHTSGDPVRQGLYWDQYAISFAYDTTMIFQPISEVYIERNTFQRGAMGWGDLSNHLWGDVGQEGGYTNNAAGLIQIGWGSFGSSAKAGVYVRNNNMTGIPARKRVGRLVQYRNVTGGEISDNNAPGYTSAGIVLSGGTSNITVTRNTLGAITRPFAAPVTTQTINVPNTIDSTGATDVGLALQAFVASVPNGSIINFPASGIYKVGDNGIRFTNKNNLIFEGNGATIWQRGTADNANGSAFALWNGNIDISIHNFNIIGQNTAIGYNSATNENRFGILVYGGSRVEISNVSMLNIFSDYILLGGTLSGPLNIPTNNIWIHDNLFTHSGRMGISPVTATHVLIENNTFDLTTWVTLDLEPNDPVDEVGWITFRNNSILRGGTNGPQFVSARGGVGTTNVHDITITNNHTNQSIETDIDHISRRSNVVFINNVGVSSGTVNFAHIDGLTYYGNIGGTFNVSDCTNVDTTP